MSSLEWEMGYRYIALAAREKYADNSTIYQLWGLPSTKREWHHDPLAFIEKIDKKWRLTIYNEQGFQQERGAYKTLKEAKAMGIALVTMEGIKHAV